MTAPLTGGQVFKITIFFNQGVWGWSDVYHFHMSTPNMDNAIKAAITLGRARAQVCDKATSVAGIRVSTIGKPGVSQLDFTSNTFVNSVLPKLPEYPSLAWLVEARTPDSDYHRHIWLRGMPGKYNIYTSEKPVSPTPPAQLLKDFSYYQFVLGNKDNSVKALGTWCIRGIIKEGPSAAVGPITSVEIGTNPEPQVFRIKVQGLPLVQGLPIRISMVRGPGTKGINGPAKVVKVISSLGDVQEVLIDRKPKCLVTTPTVTQLGIAKATNYGFFPIGGAEPVPNEPNGTAYGVSLERIATKRIGRAFFGTRGRQSTSRC